MAANSLTNKVKGFLNDAKYSLEGIATEVKAVGTGLIPVLKSDAIATGGGIKSKIALVQGVSRYGFTTARQIMYGQTNAPNRTALIDDMGELTYTELLDNTRAFARALHRHNIRTGGRIGVMCRNSRALIYALGAKGMLGAKIYLLNVASSPQQLAKSIEEHDLDVLVIDEEFTERLPEDLGKLQIVIGHAEDLNNPQAVSYTHLTLPTILLV